MMPLFWGATNAAFLKYAPIRMVKTSLTHCQTVTKFWLSACFRQLKVDQCSLKL